MAIYQIYCETCDTPYEVICSYSELQNKLKKHCFSCGSGEIKLKPSSGHFGFKDSPNSNTSVTSYDGRNVGYGDW